MRKPHIYIDRGEWHCNWTYRNERGRPAPWLVSDGHVGLGLTPYLACMDWYLQFRRLYA